MFFRKLAAFLIVTMTCLSLDSWHQRAKENSAFGGTNSLVIGSNVSCGTDVYVENGTTQTVWVSTCFKPAEHHEDWVTRGAYQISPGQRLRIATIANNTLLLHAKSNGHSWEGDCPRMIRGGIQDFLPLQIHQQESAFTVTLREEHDANKTLASSRQVLLLKPTVR